MGQVVGGRYELVELLGEGGMGVVYETADAETGRRVAVKLLSARPIAGDEALGERFRSEAKATAAVVSEHVVQVLDAGRDQRTGLTYIVMELLRGESVRTLLRRLGPLPPQLVVRIGVQIGAGLQKAHETGVVHRDIKPANVFLARTEDGRVVVKLLDFGLAKVKMEHVAGVRGGVPRPGAAMLGSPLYLSPEQAGGRATVDHRTDIWSVGVVLYELLSRRTPHHEVRCARCAAAWSASPRSAETCWWG
ncbi:MAG: serine/threonine protein kinase [Deltaproteobacteria bacterium]|nr:serine/threonine protein kinase [Deltaproteobacteria bacterium]